MADAQGSNAPAWRNCCERLEHEAAPGKLRVRDGQPARTELASAPQQKVEIEDARTPALAGAAAEFALALLQPLQHGRRVELAFDQGHGIGEIAACGAMRRVEHD